MDCICVANRVFFTQVFLIFVYEGGTLIPGDRQYSLSVYLSIKGVPFSK